MLTSFASGCAWLSYLSGLKVSWVVPSLVQSITFLLAGAWETKVISRKLKYPFWDKSKNCNSPALGWLLPEHHRLFILCYILLQDIPAPSGHWAINIFLTTWPGVLGKAWSSRWKAYMMDRLCPSQDPQRHRDIQGSHTERMQQPIIRQNSQETVGHLSQHLSKCSAYSLVVQGPSSK